MTDFRDRSDQKREKEFLLECVCKPALSGSITVMYLFIIKTLLVLFAYGPCEGFGLHEKRAEFSADNDDGPTVEHQNETAGWRQNDLTTLLQQQPSAVVVELREPLLEKVKASLGEENKTNFPLRRTILASFDSKGLRDVSVYNDTFEVRQAIMQLQPRPGDDRIYTPTVHVLEDLLQRNLPEGSVLLVTMSKPADDGSVQNLITSLARKKCGLSVIWAGYYPSGDYLQLKQVVDATGGKFGYVGNDNNSDENATEQYLPKSEFENLSEQIKFPEGEKEAEDEEMPQVSRAADQKVVQKIVVPLIVEVASGSTLEARPGAPSQVQFTIKNNINVPLNTVFNARFNGVLQNVQPPQAHIPPSATVSVIVNLQPIGTPQSLHAVGTLTLTAVAQNTATQRSALISMTPQTVTDNYPPKMTHRYEGDCWNYKEPQNCEQGSWGLEATIHDEGSGLLKVLSEPYGLLFNSQFVAGSKAPVTVYYTATCCQPNVIIWAEDLKGNYVKKSFDVFNQNLLAGEIASIVLGVLFILFIIIAIIVAIVVIKRRNRRNLIIPRPRSGSR